MAKHNKNKRKDERDNTQMDNDTPSAMADEEDQGYY